MSFCSSGTFTVHIVKSDSYVLTSLSSFQLHGKFLSPGYIVHISFFPNLICSHGMSFPPIHLCKTYPFRVHHCYFLWDHRSPYLFLLPLHWFQTSLALNAVNTRCNVRHDTQAIFFLEHRTHGNTIGLTLML